MRQVTPLLLTLALMGCGASVEPSQTPSASTTPIEESKVSLENYDKIQTGMSLDEVKAILGEGQLLTSSEMELMGQTIKTEAYNWQDGSSVISVTFQDGKVAAKSQVNLQ